MLVRAPTPEATACEVVCTLSCVAPSTAGLQPVWLESAAAKALMRSACSGLRSPASTHASSRSVRLSTSLPSAITSTVAQPDTDRYGGKPLSLARDVVAPGAPVVTSTPRAPGRWSTCGLPAWRGREDAGGVGVRAAQQDADPLTGLGPVTMTRQGGQRDRTTGLRHQSRRLPQPLLSRRHLGVVDQDRTGEPITDRPGVG